MRLNKGDKVLYDEAIYETLAVVWNTVYFQKVKDGSNDYQYTIDQVYENYRDIEFLK